MEKLEKTGRKASQNAASGELRDLPDLTEQEWTFITHYFHSRNGTQAALSAAYSGKPSSAATIAWRPLSAPHFEHEQRGLRAMEKGTEVGKHAAAHRQSTLDVLIHSRDFAPGRLFDENGDMLPWDQISPLDQAMISEVDIKVYDQGRSVKVKFRSRDAALMLLAKTSGLLMTRHERQLDDSSAESTRRWGAGLLG
jgi:phage terminase small subunit